MFVRQEPASRHHDDGAGVSVVAQTEHGVDGGQSGPEHDHGLRRIARNHGTIGPRRLKVTVRSEGISIDARPGRRLGIADGDDQRVGGKRFAARIDEDAVLRQDNVADGRSHVPQA